MVNSYIPKAYKEMTNFNDRFFVVNLIVNESQGHGLMQIQREIYNEEIDEESYHNVVEQEISFIDLPQGTYKFYLIGEKWSGNNEYEFIMLSPSEY